MSVATTFRFTEHFKCLVGLWMATEFVLNYVSLEFFLCICTGCTEAFSSHPCIPIIEKNSWVLSVWSNKTTGTWWNCVSMAAFSFSVWFLWFWIELEFKLSLTVCHVMLWKPPFASSVSAWTDVSVVSDQLRRVKQVAGSTSSVHWQQSFTGQ